MRKQIKTVLEWLHILLLFSIILPLLYMIGMERESGILLRLYGLGYLLFFAIVIVKKAVTACQKLFTYWGVCLLVLCGAVVLSWGIGKWFLPQGIRAGYILYMTVGTLAVALESYSVRIYQVRQKKARVEMDSTWMQREYTLDKPHLSICAWFVVIYVVALNFACPEVCNLSMINLFFYLMVAIAYQFIEKTEGYLSINDEVCNVQNIPYKRIFGIGKYFVLSFLLLIMLSVIPAFLTMSYREYKDIRQWVLEREVDYEELYQQEEARSYGGDPMADVVASMGEAKEMPFIIKMLFYAFGFCIFATILLAVIKWIREEMRDFGQGIDEAGDIVEALTDDMEEKLASGRSFFKPKTEEASIRREYRRFIRKHRKDRPAAYETPKEMEVIAGVDKTLEGIALHEKYEFVRYGERTTSP